MNNYTGKKFNSLTVISVSHKKFGSEKGYRTAVLCRCDCGKEGIFSLTRILSNHVKSCGCAKKKHGMKGTRFYGIWVGIRQRVNRESVYKKLGISKEWEDFINFKNDMYDEYTRHVEKFGEKETTIDRIDGRLGYSKNNCRWATYETQGNNTSANVFFTTEGGERNTLPRFARKYGVKIGTLRARIKYGWSLEQSLGITPRPPERRGRPRKPPKVKYIL